MSPYAIMKENWRIRSWVTCSFVTKNLELPTGRLCRFCHQSLKQGPNSPHTHAYFPGVPGKYIYCPSRVFSLYNAQGMEKEMTWPDFQQSDFYDAERDRWIADKRKP
ncbi:hypothetical protein KUCAC02_034326 [Chaenocephalus aceratus]|nr:hypothetical protein KUCAC02_034326 [Chaenocephalus aceratus]